MSFRTNRRTGKVFPISGRGQGVILETKSKGAWTIDVVFTSGVARKEVRIISPDGRVQYPTKLSDGRIVYDRPEGVPISVKNEIAKKFREIEAEEAETRSFER